VFELEHLAARREQRSRVAACQQVHQGSFLERGERFTLKRYRSEKTADEDGWRHVKIVLEPVNPDFTPIELKTEDEGSVAVVAELVEVIGSEPPA